MTATIDLAPSPEAALVLVGLPPATPVPSLPLPHISAGESPAERIALAVAMTWPVLHESYARARRQKGGEPVMLVAAPDCAAGRQLISQRLGFSVLDALAGPVVFALSEADAVAQLGRDGWAKMGAVLDTIGHVDGGMRLLLAVNGGEVEARVLRTFADAPPAVREALRADLRSDPAVALEALKRASDAAAPPPAPKEG
jgi:hypothetical protein